MDQSERQERLAVDLANMYALENVVDDELTEDQVWIIVAALLDSHQVMLDSLHDAVAMKNLERAKAGFELMVEGIIMTRRSLDHIKRDA